MKGVDWMGKTKVAPMWRVGDQLFHYSDYQRAESKGEVQAVMVTLPSDYFIGTVQHESVALKIVDVDKHE